MIRARLFAAAVAVMLCVAGLWWMFSGSSPDWLVGNSNVVGGVAGVAALGLAVATVLSATNSSSATNNTPDATLLSAVEHLAEETLRYWRNEAKIRQVTTPVPKAAVLGGLIFLPGSSIAGSPGRSVNANEPFCGAPSARLRRR